MIRNILIALIVIVFAGCASVTVYTSAYQPTPQKLDGHNDDWTGKMYYDSKAKMVYGMSNDNENLYVNLKIIDQTVQRKVLMTGLTLWIDTLGKKQKHFGVTCPPKIQPGMMKRDGGRRGANDQGKEKIDTEAINQLYAEGFTPMKLAGFGKNVNPITTNINSEGINMTLRLDSMQVMYYEASIPLDKLFNDPNEYLNDTTKVFSYGFETGFISMPVTPSAGRGGGMRGGGAPGGRGGMNGAGKGGGRTMGSSPRIAEMQEMSQPSKFWVKSTRLSSSMD